MTRAGLEDFQRWLFLGSFCWGSDVDIQEGDNQVGIGGIDWCDEPGCHGNIFVECRKAESVVRAFVRLDKISYSLADDAIVFQYSSSHIGLLSSSKGLC
jgi:hypothetical protein